MVKNQERNVGFLSILIRSRTFLSCGSEKIGRSQKYHEVLCIPYWSATYRWFWSIYTHGILSWYVRKESMISLVSFHFDLRNVFGLGGGVIDLMNRRLQQRLTEPEILKIFSDVCEVTILEKGTTSMMDLHLSITTRRLLICITAPLLSCIEIWRSVIKNGTMSFVVKDWRPSGGKHSHPRSRPL